jgi:hypothetical protein
MVVLPWYKTVNPLTSFSVAQIVDRRKTSSALNWGDAFVAHSRNKCAEAFLSTPLEWMLTVDDDMVVPFGDPKWFREHTKFNFPDWALGHNALDRLLSCKKTLVGALYFGRYAKSPAMYNEAAQPQEAAYARTAPINLVKPTRWVGTGCMLIHRSVFLAIENKFPRLARGADGKGGNWFTSTEASLADRVTRIRDDLTKSPITGQSAYQALDQLEAALSAVRSENELGVGEDVSFCLRAAAAGHQPHVDMGLVCGHIGHCVYGPHNTGIVK